MQVAAIVVAAGASTRFDAKTKKQFFALAGKPILVYCLQVLNRSLLINRIVLVVPADQRAAVRKNIVQKYRLTKVSDIVVGGKERTDSVWNGLQALSNPQSAIRNPQYVFIHDGVRPFITEKMIRDTVKAAKKTGAAIIATKITDTVKMANARLVIEQTIPREKLWCVQTPQVFKFSLLLDAYTRARPVRNREAQRKEDRGSVRLRSGISNGARKKKMRVTDDAGIIEQIGIPVTLVPGPFTNIKITTKEDIKIAETILKHY
jgi:2-C-methyl-D-erythritol 4-phosphate cytidylyltransferase